MLPQKRIAEDLRPHEGLEWITANPLLAADRVRAQVFAAMLSYYVDWRMRQALAPVAECSR